MPANKTAYKAMILLALLLAAIIRFAYIAQLDDKAWWVDEIDYMALGKSLATGHGYVNPDGEATAYRPPGYPLLLAAFYKIGIDDANSIRAAHVVMSLITILLLSLLSLKIAGPVAAVASTVVAAGYPYFVYSTGTLFAVTWFSMTLVASVYCLLTGLLDNRPLFFAGAGLLMGLSILTITTAAVLGLAVIAWLWIVLRGKQLLRAVFIFGVTMMMVVAPWMIRNYVALGKPVLSSNGGRNLWLGNNPASTINTGSAIELPAELEERLAGLSELEADRIYTDTAVAFIKTDPGHYAWLAVKKGLALWRFDPSPTTEGEARPSTSLRDRSPIPRWRDEAHYKSLYPLISMLSYTPIVLLALIGFYKAGRAQKRLMLLWILFDLAFTAAYAAYISKVRFRLPLDYFTIVMAACAVAFLTRRVTILQRIFHWQYLTGFDHELEKHLTYPCAPPRRC